MSSVVSNLRSDLVVSVCCVPLVPWSPHRVFVVVVVVVVVGVGVSISQARSRKGSVADWVSVWRIQVVSVEISRSRTEQLSTQHCMQLSNVSEMRDVR